MNQKECDHLKYLTINSTDEEWGIVVSTVGYQFVKPGAEYPVSKHPEKYCFNAQVGRILNEYQLVYITRGDGFFMSNSCRKRKITAGTMILLFPGEWHSYWPEKDSGWDEYWVGFRGYHIDKRVENKFFCREEPLFQIGVSADIVLLYEDILKLAMQERAGYQQIISSMVLHILGLVYYKNRNELFSCGEIVDKINEARILMKENIRGELSSEQIAEQLGVGYSWFRRKFKEYTGISPNKYQLQLKLLRAKELLSETHKNISEIAYELNFENTGQFSTFFKKNEGITPSEFKRKTEVVEKTPEQ